MIALTLLLALTLPPDDAETDAAPPPPARSERRDLRYREMEGVEAQRHSLDLYLPAGAGPFPLVVMIHGGGWRNGDKRLRGVFATKAEFLNDVGFALACVNYRLSPAVTHPAHVEDVAAALDWLADHAQEHRLDADRFFVMGHSAGAHLAALVAVDERRLAAHERDLSLIKGAILLDGAGYDVHKHLVEMAPGRLMKSIYVNAFGLEPRGWVDASPTSHVATDLERAYPPFLIFHAADRAASRIISEDLADALREAGGEALLSAAPEDSHASVNRQIGEADDPQTAEILRFLERHAAKDEAPATDERPPVRRGVRN
jgi:arylformamidase